MLVTDMLRSFVGGLPSPVGDCHSKNMKREDSTATRPAQLWLLWSVISGHNCKREFWLLTLVTGGELLPCCAAIVRLYFIIKIQSKMSNLTVLFWITYAFIPQYSAKLRVNSFRTLSFLLPRNCKKLPWIIGQYILKICFRSLQIAFFFVHYIISRVHILLIIFFVWPKSQSRAHLEKRSKLRRHNWCISYRTVAFTINIPYPSPNHSQNSLESQNVCQSQPYPVFHRRRPENLEHCILQIMGMLSRGFVLTVAVVLLAFCFLQ